MAKRKKLAQVILGFVRKGETNIDAMHRRAVIHFNSQSRVMSAAVKARLLDETLQRV